MDKDALVLIQNTDVVTMASPKLKAKTLPVALTFRIIFKVNFNAKNEETTTLYFIFQKAVPCQEKAAIVKISLSNGITITNMEHARDFGMEVVVVTRTVSEIKPNVTPRALLLKVKINANYVKWKDLAVDIIRVGITIKMAIIVLNLFGADALVTITASKLPRNVKILV